MKNWPTAANITIAIKNNITTTTHLTIFIFLVFVGMYEPITNDAIKANITDIPAKIQLTPAGSG